MITDSAGGDTVPPADHGDRPGSVTRAVALVVVIGAAVIGLWYAAVVGTRSPVMLAAVVLGYGIAHGITAGLRRHGPAIAAISAAVTVVLLTVGLFYVNRWQLNEDPRNHIPAWPNPSWVRETIAVSLDAWPTQWWWIGAAILVAALVGWHGTERWSHAHLYEPDDTPVGVADDE